MRKRYWEDKPFLICGHRGSPGKFPENTIESFDEAIKDGANALEFDLSIMKDNEIIIWHDWNPNDLNALLRENGFEPDVKYKPVFPAMFSESRKAVNEFTLEECRKYFSYADKQTGEKTNIKIPTLRDFLEWSKDKQALLYIFLDLKIPAAKADLVETFINLLQELLVEFKPSYKIIIETDHKEILKKLLKENSVYSPCLDIEPPGGFIFLPRLYSAVNAAIKNKNNFALAIKPRQITIGSWITHRRIINYDVRKRARFNRRHSDKKIEYLIGCTINKEPEMECLIKLGIGGIQTDYPKLLKEVAERMGRIK